MISYIFHCFSKTELFISLKKSFSFFVSFLKSVFLLMYGFNHSFLLNWITLYTFFNIKPWFSACLKAIISIAYFSLSYISQVSFSTFSIFLLSGKNGKSLWELNKVLDTVHLLQENILYYYFHLIFLIKIW